MAISNSCPDCNSEHGSFTRREFIKATAAGVTAASAGVVASPTFGAEEKKQKPQSETLVKQLYESLEEEQKAKCCFTFDDPLRLEVDNNWHITDARVGRNFNSDQQDLIQQIFLGLHSEEYEINLAL